MSSHKRDSAVSGDVADSTTPKYRSGRPVFVPTPTIRASRRTIAWCPVRAAAPGAGARPGAIPAVSRNVFVVYGHTEKAKTELEAMLRRWGLEPLILDQLTSGGATIIEKLQRAQASLPITLCRPTLTLWLRSGTTSWFFGCAC
jgi:predicted nucleotide-binding protein